MTHWLLKEAYAGGRKWESQIGRGGGRRGRETQRERVSESIGNLLFETNILVGNGGLTGVCVFVAIVC